MGFHTRFRQVSSLILILSLIHGCGTVLQPVATTGSVLYTQGARQHTAMLQIQLAPAEVYHGLLKVIASRSDLKTLNTNAQRYLVEVARNGEFLSAQATSLSANETLLFIWADAGKSGRTGQDLARSAAEQICIQLAVKCVVKDN